MLGDQGVLALIDIQRCIEVINKRDIQGDTIDEKARILAEFTIDQIKASEEKESSDTYNDISNSSFIDAEEIDSSEYAYENTLVRSETDRESQVKSLEELVLTLYKRVEVLETKNT
jgi:hypothetical protein